MKVSKVLGVFDLQFKSLNAGNFMGRHIFQYTVGTLYRVAGEANVGVVGRGVDFEGGGVEGECFEAGLAVDV